jgi:hypothetical protein
MNYVEATGKHSALKRERALKKMKFLNFFNFFRSFWPS